ncbi:MAG: 4'-phosphopantetheinyl transferase superfamily protein [Prevotella sp.]|nr:4'-phosphopantetheinyl transferase superfamily protein [Prevotella sp.]
MALIFHDVIAEEAVIGVWKIEEDEKEVLSQHPHLAEIVKNYSRPERRMEKLSAYLLLYSLQADAQLLIGHNPDGKPLLDGWHISVSDTRGFVAVVLSKTNSVGIDIEFISNRVDRIAKRFIRPDEMADNTMKRLLTWSVKEAVYKYCSEEHLDYFDMRLHPFDLSQNGIIEVDNLKNNTTLRVRYIVTSDYVLAYL